VVWTENLPRSDPIHFLHNFSATDNVVHEPLKKSHIISHSFEDVLIIFSSNASGFWVGYQIFSELTPNNHTSRIECSNTSSLIIYTGFPFSSRTISAFPVLELYFNFGHLNCQSLRFFLSSLKI